MKGETQSLHLQRMMQKHNHYPEYDLVLPLFSIKKKSLKKLQKNDLLLLGLDRLELVIKNEENICTNVSLENHGETVKIQILDLVESLDMTYDSKKYENVLCSFGKIQIRKIEVGYKIEIPVHNLNDVELISEGKKLAKCLLVNVDEEIALKITEVI